MLVDPQPVLRHCEVPSLDEMDGPLHVDWGDTRHPVPRADDAFWMNRESVARKRTGGTPASFAKRGSG